MSERVDHPAHYTAHPSGIECIDVVEHMGFCLGNAIKYIWRADLKGDAIEDLRKARWYIEREIARREAAADDARVEGAGQVLIKGEPDWDALRRAYSPTEPAGPRPDSGSTVASAGPVGPRPDTGSAVRRP